MRNLAEQSKDIQHSELKPTFHRITNLSTLEEMLNNMGTVDGYQMIVEDVQEGMFLDQGASLIDYPTFRFYVVKNAPANDFNAIEQAKSACKDVVRKIIGRIRRDNYNDASGETSNGLRDLERNSFQYFSVGPMLDGFWGIQCSFNIHEHANCAYNANDWNE
jgi:hypothetical protein